MHTHTNTFKYNNITNTLAQSVAVRTRSGPMSAAKATDVKAHGGSRGNHLSNATLYDTCLLQKWRIM